MKRFIWLGILLTVASTTGCVERRMIVNSDPPDAMVYRNGMPVGNGPADDFFVYYGTYHFTLVKDGYETLQVYQPVATPWYEWPGLDFFTENVWPFKVRDVRSFTFHMQPLQSVAPMDVLFRGRDLRTRAEAITPLDPDGKPLPASPGLPAGASSPLPAAAAPAPAAPPAPPPPDAP